MPDFMMIMKGPSGPDSEGDWESYINKVQASGFFRGGSMLGNGSCLNKLESKAHCSVTGFMKFEAENINHRFQVQRQFPLTHQ